MIYDTFEHLVEVGGLGSLLLRALEFARDFDASRADGRYEIEGQALFANVMSYETKAHGGVFEAHQKYLDVQVVLAGQEIVEVAQGDGLRCVTPFDKAKDVSFWEATGPCHSIVLRGEGFVVLYPQDVHRPGRQVNGPAAVRKLVVKVLI